MVTRVISVLHKLELEYSKNTYPAALFAWSPSQIIDIIDTVTHR